jgi:hypothetical protein
MGGSLCQPSRPIRTGLSINFMALTMIDSAFSSLKLWSYRQSTDWLLRKKKVKREQSKKIFDKSSDRIARLVDRIGLCRYLRCRYLIYDNRSEFKLHFETQRKLATIKNLKVNAICERVHQILGTMMCTSEMDMANSVEPADIDTSINNTAWAFC